MAGQYGYVPLERHLVLHATPVYQQELTSAPALSRAYSPASIVKTRLSKSDTVYMECDVINRPLSLCVRLIQRRQMALAM